MRRVQGSGVRVQAVLGGALLALIVTAVLFAPVLAPADPTEQHEDFPYAPPMIPHVLDDDWRPHVPFVYAIHLADRLNRTYLQDRSDLIPVFLNAEARSLKPVFLLGTDALGRDVWARLLHGGRASLGIAAVATILAIVIGIILGAVAGYAGGVADEAAMRVADLVLVLPAIYVVLTLRAVMPLVLSPWQVFTGISIVLSLVGWPLVARAVRAIVSRERSREYTEAARAAGASPARILFVHVLPAARGAIAVQAALLVPAFVLAEATLSFVGFGFAEPIPSWGTLLQEAGSVRVFGDYPWLLAPACAIAILSLAVNLVFTAIYGWKADVQF